MQTSDQLNNKSSYLKSTTEKLYENYKKKGVYFNSSYEIENFINLVGVENSEAFNYLNDPTVTGFKLFFHFGAHSGLLADKEHTNSAEAYLLRIGHKKKAELLSKFKEILSKVNSICPWIFQDISGLKEAFEKSRTEVLNDKRELEINTLETIDGKIGSLVKMYRDITFDENRWAWIVPENLRKFSMSVYVYDYRMFLENTSEGNTKHSNFIRTINSDDVKNINHTLFDLGECEFNEKSGGNFFENINNNASEFSKNNLSINFEEIVISSLFKTITGDLELNSSNFELAQIGSGQSATNVFGDQGEENILERLKNTQLFEKTSERVDELEKLLDKQNRKEMMGNMLDDAELRATDRVEAELSQLYFGNVHGFGPEDILKLNQGNNYKYTFNNIYSSVDGNQSLNNSVKKPKEN